MKTEAFELLPIEIRHQIDLLAAAPETPKLADIRQRLAANWTDKFELFLTQTKLLEMVELDELPDDDSRGLIALTYSGSLISLGPRTSGRRWLEYVAIPLRCDVPDIVSSQAVEIKGAVRTTAVLEFEKGPIQATSAVYRFAVCAQGLSVDEQDRRIREAAIFLTHSFMKINRTLTPEARGADQFTIKGMAQYVARKNDLTAVLVKKVLEDFFVTAETGLLLGERVSLSRLGTLSLKVKPAQKARIVKNLVTGADILIPAKPEVAVPRFSVPAVLKGKAALVDPAKL